MMSNLPTSLSSLLPSIEFQSQREKDFILNLVQSTDYYLGVNIPFPELRCAKAMRSHMFTYYERTEKPWNL